MKDWIKTLATVAPSIATAIGGPLAGVAVKVATSALGIENDPNALEDALLVGDPDTLFKLKSAENDFKIEMKRLDIDLARIDGQDRNSARDMAKQNMMPQVILSTLYTVGYMIVMWYFLMGEVSVAADVKTLFGSLLGVLTAAQVQILNFWFGSSHGSKTKIQGS